MWHRVTWRRCPQHHNPWVAYHNATSRFYSSEFSNVTWLYVYDDGMVPQVALQLKGLEAPLQGVQGGEFYGDTLYISMYVVERVCNR